MVYVYTQINAYTKEIKEGWLTDDRHGKHGSVSVWLTIRATPRQWEAQSQVKDSVSISFHTQEESISST